MHIKDEGEEEEAEELQEKAMFCFVPVLLTIASCVR
jgi:hypothetical protein